MVDISPDTTGPYKEARTIRMRWARLYEYYAEFWKTKMMREPLSEARFLELRKEHRPFYIRHRKAASRKTWNHMECTECTELDTLLRKATKSKAPQLRKDLEMKLEQHWADQELHRNHQSLEVVKGIENSDFDMVCHIDGGSAGSEFLPFFFQDVASGEPFPHKCLRVKNTFVQIHGWGNLVFQTYPVIEPQSTNLTIEVTQQHNHVPIIML